MRFYDKYKPFRNYMRRFPLVESLADVWRYSWHIVENKPLPHEYAVGKPAFARIIGNIWPWEIEILAREIVLNAGTRGDHNLRRWNDLVKAINYIKHPRRLCL